MKTRDSKIAILGIILLSFITGICLYPRMPERMASHWNVQGQVDGYMSKFWGMFLMPFICVGLFFLFVLIPKIDPLKANIEKFRKYYDGFVLLIIIFLIYLYLLTIFWNVGVRFNIVQFSAPALGILFYYSGILMEHIKQNWFIGIRTPWTLSNEKIWDKTHKIGGRLFKIAGVISLLGVIFEDYALFFVFVPVILVTVYTTIYSYFEYQKEIQQ